MRHKIQKNCQKIFQDSVQFLFLISFPDCKSGLSVIAHGFSNFLGGILLFYSFALEQFLKAKTRNNCFSQTLVMTRLPPIFFFRQLYFIYG